MTAFTRCKFDLSRRVARRLVGSPSVLHASVAAACGDSEKRVLWRLDRYPPDTVDLYVVSESEPERDGDLGHAATTWESTDYDRLLHQLGPGQTWRFRLTANPVRVVSSPVVDGKRSRGKVQPLTTAAQQLDWLVERAPKWGFSVAEAETPTAEVVERSRLSFRRSTGRVTLSTATYQGMLSIEDADAFRSVLRSGVGRAKGYGCGLLTLARP